MITRFLISPTRLDINRTIRLDRRMDTTDGFWWEEYKEDEFVKTVRICDNTPLIIDAFGLINQEINVENFLLVSL